MDIAIQHATIYNGVLTQLQLIGSNKHTLNKAGLASYWYCIIFNYVLIVQYIVS